MKRETVSCILNAAIAGVWLLNGLFCKILNLVPRHAEIAGRILGHSNSFLFTKLIGIGEVIIFLWVLSRVKPKFCAGVQIALVVAMNLLEFVLVPDLLLFGRWNLFFAAILVAAIKLNALLQTGIKNAAG